MKTTSRRFLLTILALLAPSILFGQSGRPADDLEYSFVEIRGSERDLGDLFALDRVDNLARVEVGDNAGITLAGSVRISPRFYLGAEYTHDLDVDVVAQFSTDGQLAVAAGVFDSHHARLALGTRWSVGPRVDLFAEVGAEVLSFTLPRSVEVDLPSGISLVLTNLGIDDVKADARVGFRFLPVPRLEVAAWARYSQLQLDNVTVANDNDLVLDEGVLGGIALMGRFGEHFGLGVSVEAGDVTRTDVHLRWRF